MSQEKENINIQIIIGSTRQGRYSDKPAKWIAEEFQKMEGVTAEIVDLRDYPLPFFDEPMSPMWLNGQYSNPDVKRWSDKVKEADAFVMISPEYNHGYTAVLKNAIDHLYPEWKFKPAGFLSFGGAAGARVVEQMRLVVIELQMFPIKNAIHIPVDVYIATMKLTPDETVDIYSESLRKGYRDMVHDFTNELVEVTRGTASLRPKQIEQV